jgi:hypothetical protein
LDLQKISRKDIYQVITNKKIDKTFFKLGKKNPKIMKILDFEHHKVVYE